MKLCNALENMTLRLLLMVFVATSFAVFGQDIGFVAGTAVDGRSGLPREEVTLTLNGKSKRVSLVHPNLEENKSP